MAGRVSPAVPSAKNLLIGLLAASTAGAAALAWQQHRALVTLRDTVVAGSERATWERKLAAAQERVVLVEKQLAETKRASSVPKSDPAVRNGPLPGEPVGPGRRWADMREVMEDPEMQRLMLLRHRGALDGRYADLFKRLNLSPAQLEQLKTLLAERQLSMRDTFSAAREQGLNPRDNPEAFRKLIETTRNSIDESIRELLGDAGYAQFQRFETTEPQRRAVSQLQQRLSYTGAPLTTAQSDQLVQILSASGSPQITESTLNQARGVLSTVQVEALEQLYQEQQAQLQFSETMRNRFSPPDGAPPPPPGAPLGSG